MSSSKQEAPQQSKGKFKRFVEKLMQPFRRKPEPKKFDGGGKIQTLWGVRPVQQLLSKAPARSRENFTAVPPSTDPLALKDLDFPRDFYQEDPQQARADPREAIRQQLIKEEIRSEELERKKSQTHTHKLPKGVQDTEVQKILKNKNKQEREREHKEFLQTVDITQSYDNYVKHKELQRFAQTGEQVKKWEPFEKRRIDDVFDLSKDDNRAVEIYQKMERDVQNNPEYEEKKRQVFEYLQNNDVSERTYVQIINSLKKFEDRSEKVKYFNPENFRKPKTDARNFNDFYLSSVSYLDIVRNQQNVARKKAQKVAEQVKNSERVPFRATLQSVSGF